MKKGLEIYSHAENSLPRGLSISAIFNTVMPRGFYSASQPCKKWLGAQITTFWDELVSLRVREKYFRDDFIKTAVWKKGFTLIELLVVVLIIGILSAVALPQYEKAVEKSRAAEALNVMNSLEKAVNLYILESGYPSSTVTFLGNNADGSLSIDLPCQSKTSNSCVTKDFEYGAFCDANACHIGAFRGGNLNGISSAAEGDYHIDKYRLLLRHYANGNENNYCYAITNNNKGCASCKGIEGMNPKFEANCWD